jgi:hypothetical protein
MTSYRELMELIGTLVDSVGVLIIVVGAIIIRTFLSMALQLEVEGRWPWKRGDEAQKEKA